MPSGVLILRKQLFLIVYRLGKLQNHDQFFQNSRFIMLVFITLFFFIFVINKNNLRKSKFYNTFQVICDSHVKYIRFKVSLESRECKSCRDSENPSSSKKLRYQGPFTA